MVTECACVTPDQGIPVVILHCVGVDEAVISNNGRE